MEMSNRRLITGFVHHVIAEVDVLRSPDLLSPRVNARCRQSSAKEA